MYWTDVDHSFCEANMNGLPEYYNAISSLFIMGFGINGMMNIYNELFVDILYANLIIVGFGSVGYHWYGNIGWGLFDEIPMILSIFIGIIYTDNVHYLTSKRMYEMDIKRAYEHDATSINYLLYKRKCKLCVYLFLMSVIIINNTMSNFRKLFPTIFACVAGYLYYKIFMLLRVINIQMEYLVATKTYNSILTIAVSGAIWVATEASCNYIQHPIFLIGHPMWHLFIGHGFYNLIQVVYFIKLNDMDRKLEYNRFYLLQGTQVPPPMVIET